MPKRKAYVHEMLSHAHSDGLREHVEPKRSGLPPAYEPSPEEISAMCEKIRAEREVREDILPYRDKRAYRVRVT
jgi:hypothetical protein